MRRAASRVGSVRRGASARLMMGEKKKEPPSSSSSSSVSSSSVSALSSWEHAGRWYDGLVGQEGHHYHKEIVLPGVLRLLRLDATEKKARSLLDLGCGQGILGRLLPEGVEYVGIDASKYLITRARNYDKTPGHHYAVADVTRPYTGSLPDKMRPVRGEADGHFTHAAFVLSLQNMRDQSAALRLASEQLAERGELVIVLNHPCFRVPRQSRWDIDQQNNVQYRRVDRYHSALEVPIVVHPSKKDTAADSREAIKDSALYSFHYPLEHYFRCLNEAGMAVKLVEEWYSDKTSEGAQAKRENRARKEFPLFLTISAFKLGIKSGSSKKKGGRST